MQSRSRIAASEVHTSDGEFRVLWISGDYPVELLVPERKDGVYHLNASEAYHLGQAIVEHALASGHDPLDPEAD
jgi:hypothetical protein